VKKKLAAEKGTGWKKNIENPKRSWEEGSRRAKKGPRQKGEKPNPGLN